MGRIDAYLTDKQEEERKLPASGFNSNLSATRPTNGRFTVIPPLPSLPTQTNSSALSHVPVPQDADAAMKARLSFFRHGHGTPQRTGSASSLKSLNSLREGIGRSGSNKSLPLRTGYNSSLNDKNGGARQKAGSSSSLHSIDSLHSHGQAHSNANFPNNDEPQLPSTRLGSRIPAGLRSSCLEDIASGLQQQASGRYAKGMPVSPPTEDDDPSIHLREELQSEIQPLPTAPPPPPNFEYHDNGRVTKESMLKNTKGQGQPGAYSEGEANPFGGVYNNPVSNYDQVLSGSNPDLLNQELREVNQELRDENEEQNKMEGNNNNDVTSRDSNRSVGATHKNVPWWRRGNCVYMAVVALVLVMAAVAIPVVVSNGGNSSVITAAVELVEEDEEDGIDLTLVANMTQSTVKAIIEEPDSPQARAYDWMAKDPDLDTYEDWRKQQRFALACAYHTFTKGESPNYSLRGMFLDKFGYHFDECRWQSVSDICPGGDGIVRRLSVVGDGGQNGFFPPEIAFLSHLAVVDIGAKFSPTLEALLPLDTPNSMPSLKELILSDSEKAGTIPSTLGLLTSLTHLDLGINKLESTIPSELGLLSNLASLVLSTNLLSGTIPEEIGHLTSLTILEVDNNYEIKAPVPTGFCAYEHLPLLESLETDWCSGVDDCCSNLRI